MFGLKYIKADPTVYLIEYRGGKPVREGAGQSFFYFAPMTSLVAVPIATTEVPFIFKEVTADFQDVTVQGQAVYRIADPVKTAQMMNFTIDPITRDYVSEDPLKLPQRVINLIQVLFRDELHLIGLRDTLASADAIVKKVKTALVESKVLEALGVTVIDLSILAIKPTPETARALEAGVREELLKKADEAIYGRRNAAIEKERAIKENELNTEIAVEVKKRNIRETQMDAERAVFEKKRVIADEEMTGKIALEEKKKTLVNLNAENIRVEADTKAYGVAALMEAVAKTDPRVLTALTSSGMEPAQLIALSFMELAGSATKIGELNISPDLLNSLMNTKKALQK